MAEISYKKTEWRNNVTPLNEENMNHIENGIETLATELEKKIEKPEVAPTVGTVLKVTAVNDDGTFTCAWAEESGGVDVQIAGASIVQDGVANIPYGTDKNVGVLRTTSANGLYIQDGVVRTYPASDSNISNRNGQYMPLTTKNLDYAVKAAMCDGKGAAWTDTEKAAARSRMGVINGSTGKRFSLPLLAIPDNAEQLHTDTNGNKTLCRMTKANFLAFASNCTAEMYERMLQGALVTQNDGNGAAVSSTLITYPPRYVGVGMRIPKEWLNATTLFDVMVDRRIAFFPDFETGHESDIYFMFYGDSTKPIIDIIVY